MTASAATITPTRRGARSERISGDRTRLDMPPAYADRRRLTSPRAARSSATERSRNGLCVRLRGGDEHAQAHRPPDALGQVPVPGPEELHGGGNEQRAHDRRV